MTYSVIFGRDGFEQGQHVLLHGFVQATVKTLEEARAARVVLGDLVFHTESRVICTDPSWLFEIEREQLLFPKQSEPPLYAIECIKGRVKLARDFWNTETKQTW